MSKSGKLAKNTLLYAIGSIGSKILTFLIVPLYTFYISTDEMGVYDAIITSISLCSPIIVLSIYEGVYRWSIQSKENAGKYIRYGLFFELRNLLIASLVYFVACYFFAIPYFLWIWLYTVQICLHSYMDRITRALGNTRLFTISGVIYTLIFLFCNCILIIYFKLGIKSFLISGVAAGFFVSILLFASQRKEIFNSANIKLSIEERKGILKYSIAITPNDICWWIVGLSDRYALMYFVGASANGIYSISQKFPTVIVMLTSIFYMAWQDQSLANYEKEDKNLYYTSVFNLYSRLLLCVSLYLIIFTKYIVIWFMAQDYASAWIYVAPLYLGTIFSAFASFYGVGYLGAKQTSRALLTTGVAALVNLVVNMLFIPFFPKIGILIASISTLISYLVLFIIRLRQTKRYFNITIEKKSFFTLLSLNILFGIVVVFSNYMIDILLLLIALAFTILFLKNYVNHAVKFVKAKFAHFRKQ